MKVRHRYIPILLIKDNGIYKTRRFKKPKYIGDPINIVKIFNEKEVDEIVLLDIDASKKKRPPNYELLKDITSECFMPVSYGGGIKSIEIARELLSIGVEKIIVNSSAWFNSVLIKELVEIFGSSTIIGSVDIKKNWRNKYYMKVLSGTKRIYMNPFKWIKSLEEDGIGELLVTSIDKDGEMSGYDKYLVDNITKLVSIPVIAAGGASNYGDLKEIIDINNASAAAAGSLFVFHGKHRAVLITYPNEEDRQ